MPTKIAVTVTPDSEILPPEQMDQAMIRTISTLAALGTMPFHKFTLAIECKDEDAEQLEDQLDAALSGRPMGIEVVLKTTKERHIARVSRDTSRPMDTLADFAGRHGVERVELSSGGRSVTLTPETRRKAEALLETPVGSDTPPTGRR